MIGQHPKPLWGPLPFPKPKTWTLYSKMPSLDFPRPSQWVLTPVKLPFFKKLEKMNLFKMLDFQWIHFSRKRPWKRAALFAQPNCENKSFAPNHQIPSQCPIQRFLAMITNFCESLKKKKTKRWLFRNNKSSFGNILVSGTEEASF